MKMNLLSNIKSSIRNFIGKKYLPLVPHPLSFILYTLTLILTATLLSCTDKDIDFNEQSQSSSSLDIDGEKLTFAINVNEDFSTRATDQWDNYIDTDNMFQILFFDKDGNFLFEPLKLISATDNVDETEIITEKVVNNFDIDKSPDHEGQWYVTIHLTKDIVDRSKNPIKLSLIKEALEKDQFKIAILANWQHDSSWTVTWGWDESALKNPLSCKNINDLHSLRSDPSTGLWNDNGELSTTWVQETLKLNKREGADEWIRDNYNPSRNFNESEFIYKYKTANLWQLWNFGGSYEDNALEYGEIWADTSVKQSDKYKEEWQTRNANSFKDWFEKLKNPTTGEYGNITNRQEIDGLEIVPGEENDWKDSETYPDNIKPQYGGGIMKPFIYEDGDKSYYGILLPQTNYYFKESVNGKDQYYIKASSEHSKGYIHFKAPANGTLRIKFGSSNAGSNTKIIVQRNSGYDSNSSNYSSLAPTDYKYDSNGGGGKGVNIPITQDPENIYIFCISSTPAVIYSIEYICNQYLYETDRQGISPSANKLIPMYGVQNFDKIEAWGSDDVINLSATGKYIELIRSVAKVEVYFPGRSEVQKVIMRSMNRRARVEPADVFNPTIDSWTKNTGVQAHAEGYCEAFDIMKYGSGYSAWMYNRETDYSNWMNWYFQSRGETYTKRTNVPDYYPHVFNPYNNRSDFCEFIKEEGLVDGMQKFVLYVPDKNIDDAESNLSDTPKVPHIEYRYSTNTSYLDDNDCYRIYFCNYSDSQSQTINDLKGLTRNDYDNFEKNLDPQGNQKNYLDDLWPIMRNHIYRFYINSNNKTEEIRVSVVDWDKSPDPKKEPW